MPWKPGDALPYDGFYNGNAELMIRNGTYADFRPKLEERVRYGLLKPENLARWDEQWDKMDIAEKKRLRARVVEDSTPKPVEIVTSKGKVIAMKSKPSENNNASEDTKQKGMQRMPRPVKHRPKGALTNENNPLVSTK